MTDPMTDPSDDYGRCRCGCGQPTTIATVTRTDRGVVKGEPLAYVRGHGNRRYDRAAFATPGAARCGCGCGQPTTIATRTWTHRGHRTRIGTPMRYVTGHSSRTRPAGVACSTPGCRRPVYRRGLCATCSSTPG